MMGHVHNSLRTCPTFNWTCVEAGNAPVYVISGSAGALLEPYPLQQRVITQWYNYKNNGFSKVTAVNETHLLVQWIRNVDGLVDDEAWVTKN